MYDQDEGKNHRLLFLFSDSTPATVLAGLGSTHADTNCPRADYVSSCTMVLIGMGVSYGVGTRVFVQ